MLNKIAIKLSNRLIHNKVITEDVLDIYVYGLELLISSFFSTVFILLIGLILGHILQTIIFLLVFMGLRNFTGGYHALTYSRCSIVTFTSFVVVLVLSEIINVNFYAYCVLAIVGLPLIIIFAPIENSNKRITEEKRILFKIIGVVIFSLWIVLGIILMKINYCDNDIVFFTLLADIVLLFMKNEKERRRKDEGC